MQGLPELHAVLQRRLSRRYVRTVCCMILGVFLIIQTVCFATTDRGPTIFGPYLGADFAVFYVAGSIYNAHPAEKIYDIDLHTRTYRNLFPDVPPEGQLPYVNTPFFILPFALLAHLPYQWAYLLWMAVSCALYFEGLKLLRKAYCPLPDGTWLTALLLSFSFAPFLFEGIGGGQVSVFGFFWLCLALSLEKRGRNLAAGAALAFLLYKPTLLVLILPMLLVTRRSRHLCGFAMGSAALGLLSLLAVGWQGCEIYLRRLFLFLHVATDSSGLLRTWKYVDINSFSRLLAGDPSWVTHTIVAAAAAAMLPFLFSIWIKARRGQDLRQVWAVTLAWTPVLNVYLGIYDTILVVPGVTIMAGLLWREGVATLPAGFIYLLSSLYVVPWLTQPLAQSAGLQPYTLVLSACGFYAATLGGSSTAV